MHTSAASLPGGRERTLTLNALSKAYSMTGWRLGWITGPADLMARVRELKAAITGATSIISQHAGIAALTGPQDAVQMMAEAYSRRRRIMLDALDEMGLDYGVPQGGQFVFADIGFTGMDSFSFAKRVLSEQHVLAYPGGAFSEASRHYIRMTFLQPEEKLREGMERMKIALRGIVAEGRNSPRRLRRQTDRTAHSWPTKSAIPIWSTTILWRPCRASRWTVWGPWAPARKRPPSSATAC